MEELKVTAEPCDDGKSRASVLELQVLCRLTRGEAHGWQLIREFANHGLEVEAPSLYKVLKRLKLKGLVHSAREIVSRPAGGNDKVRYRQSLTSAGRSALRSMMKHVCPYCADLRKGGDDGTI